MKKIFKLFIYIYLLFGLLGCSNNFYQTELIELELMEENYVEETTDYSSAQDALLMENLLKDISVYTQGELKENVSYEDTTNIEETALEIELVEPSLNSNNGFKQSTSMKSRVKKEEKTVVITPTPTPTFVNDYFDESNFVGYDEEITTTPSYQVPVYEDTIYIEETPVVISPTYTVVEPEPTIPPSVYIPPVYTGPIKVSSYEGFNCDTSNVENLLTQIPQTLKNCYHKEFVYVIDNIKYVSPNHGAASGLNKAGVIYVVPDSDYHNLLHEFAHSCMIDYNLANILSPYYEIYKDTFKTSRNSYYGQSDVNEFGAECITEYYLNPSYLETNYFDVYSILLSYLG